MDENPYKPPETPRDSPETLDDSSEHLDNAPPRKWYALTLVEILVVMAVIGMLSALLMPAVQSSSPRRSRSNTVESTVTPDQDIEDPMGEPPEIR